MGNNFKTIIDDFMKSNSSFVLIGFCIIMAIVLVAQFLYYIKDYYISENQLLIKRRLNTFSINLYEVIEIELFKGYRPFLLIYLFANNSFQRIGTAWHYKYGIIHVYKKYRKDSILLTLRDNKKYLISQDDNITSELKTRFNHLLKK